MVYLRTLKDEVLCNGYKRGLASGTHIYDREEVKGNRNRNEVAKQISSNLNQYFNKMNNTISER
jgi:hypothetical protein